MSSAGGDLKRGVEAFRRAQALSYLDQLAGRPAGPVSARAWLGSERALELREEAKQSGELSDREDAALCAHMARATLEARYAPARAGALGLSSRAVSVEGDTRQVGALLGEWSVERGPSQRHILAKSLEPEFAALAGAQIEARARADGHAAALLRRLAPGRHPDAGPEQGNAANAERWLGLTDDLADEAFAFARRQFRVEQDGGLETLWALTGSALSGLFPRPGRYRRLAADWEPLGLRRALRSHARLALEHPGPGPGVQVVALAVPRELRLSPSAAEFGLASELCAADALGRAVGQAHASMALHPALRHAPVGSVARALGQLGVLLFADPLFLRRVRGLAARESQEVARLALGFALADARLCAAAVLARGQSSERELERVAAHGERALRGSLPPGWGSLLSLRLSPGGAFRAKSLAPALAHALRERYDEDWFLNPRAAEPLRGALSRSGDFSVEGWAEELGASFEQGPRRLAEVF